MLSDFEVETTRATISDLQLQREEAAVEQLKATEGNADAILKIQQDLARDLIQIEIDQTEWLLKYGEITTEERIKQERRLRDLKLDFAKEEFQTGKENADKLRELDKERLRSAGDAVNEGFNLTQQIFSNQSEAAKKRYEEEKAAAGDNAEAKIIAERKYQEEDLKLRRKQAIADKAQAVFNIGLSLAMASAELNVFQVVAAGLALAAVLAKPIPEFFKGTNNAPETFIAGDSPNSKGASELIELQSGESFLTPAKPTLFSDPKFKGATVYPIFHDKTQKMLNSYASNQGANVFVDMSKTNKHLESLVQNTKGKEERYTDAKGRQFVKRGTYTTQII